MDSLPSVSPSMVLPPTNPFHRQTRRIALFSRAPHPRLLPRLVLVSPKPCSRRRRRRVLKDVSCNLGGGGGGGGAVEGGGDDDGIEEVERALHMDGTIPGTSNEFVKRVSSRAYDMRRHLQQSFDSSSYDALRWESYGGEGKELQKIAMRVLSLTCSAIECERNRNTFDEVHSKRRNRLEQQRLNALVYVKYNLQLEMRQKSREQKGNTYDPILNRMMSGLLK